MLQYPLVRVGGPSEATGRRVPPGPASAPCPISTVFRGLRVCEETRVQERACAFDVRERSRRRVSLRALFRVRRRRRRRRRRPQRPVALTMPLCSAVQVAASRSSVGIEISRPWGRLARAAQPRSGGPCTVYINRERCLLVSVSGPVNHGLLLPP